MSIALRFSELHSILNVDTVAPSERIFTGVAPLDQAGPDDIAFFFRPEFTAAARNTRAGLVITSTAFADYLPPQTPRLCHPDPEEAMATLLEYLAMRTKPQGGAIHHTASIAPSSTIAKNARIGAGTIIGEHVHIGDEVEIGARVVIEDGVTIGEGTVIESGAVIRSGTVIGKRCRIGSGAVIGSEGFGFIERNGRYRHLYHVGNVVIGDDVEVGANSCVDRGLLGTTIIEDGVKIDNLVHIAHNVVIGEHTAIAAQAGIAGSTHVGKRNRIGGQAGLTGHISTCDDVTIGAQSGVSKSITQPGEYSGTPAVPLQRRLRSEAALRQLVELVPIIESLAHKFAPKPTDQLRDEQE
ncbi:MAG: UDP-3-O-(3-hydroxymyristoyl)glucosamine N-acyltransferase [Chlorobiota bacterium]|nr:MAG: UDP-3-O-(3-hydroxymyristoyl)glucosamine N-acyltransferase [Chlorobiota bacterium]